MLYSQSYDSVMPKMSPMSHVTSRMGMRATVQYTNAEVAAVVSPILDRNVNHC